MRCCGLYISAIHGGAFVSGGAVDQGQRAAGQRPGAVCTPINSEARTRGERACRTFSRGCLYSSDGAFLVTASALVQRTCLVCMYISFVNWLHATTNMCCAYADDRGRRRQRLAGRLAGVFHFSLNEKKGA